MSNLKQLEQSEQLRQIKQVRLSEQVKRIYEKPEIEITIFEIEDTTCSISGIGATWGELPIDF